MFQPDKGIHSAIPHVCNDLHGICCLWSTRVTEHEAQIVSWQEIWIPDDVKIRKKEEIEEAEKERSLVDQNMTHVVRQAEEH